MSMIEAQSPQVASPPTFGKRTALWNAIVTTTTVSPPAWATDPVPAQWGMFDFVVPVDPFGLPVRLSA